MFMDIFQALAEPTRRNIIEVLALCGQMTATDIYEKFSSSPPAISQHLKVLREVKLVTVEKRAQNRLYQLNHHKIRELEGWVHKLKQHWNERFDLLDELIKQETLQQKK